MDRKIIVILPGTRDTSRNIARYLRGLDVEIKIMPVIDVKVNYDEVEQARRVFSSGFKPDISIFTSKTAVKIVKKLIPDAWKYAEKYSIAIGPGTANLLRRLGGKRIEYPEEHSSKGLIKHLADVPESITLAGYCSTDVNHLLEEFIVDYFKESYLWKLYSLSEKTVYVEKLIELVRKQIEKTFVIVVTSLKVLTVISGKSELLTKHGNVFFSVISRRLVEEASRLRLNVDHFSSTDNVREYYLELKRYIYDLMKEPESSSG